MPLSLNLLQPAFETGYELPFFDGGISCGLPSPAYESVSAKLDVTRELVKNPLTTFYARVSGQSMIDDGISDGDLLVIDRSLQPCLLYTSPSPRD